MAIGEDPTDVERCMLKIRQRGAFKPYGAAVSVIEHALWDIAGKAAGVPAYKLLGGKVRDKVRVYNGGRRRAFYMHTPEEFAADVKWMMEQPEQFSIIKHVTGFHSPIKDAVEDFHYGHRISPLDASVWTQSGTDRARQPSPFTTSLWTDQGQISERGMAHLLDCVAAMGA